MGEKRNFIMKGQSLEDCILEEHAFYSLIRSLIQQGTTEFIAFHLNCISIEITEFHLKYFIRE